MHHALTRHSSPLTVAGTYALASCAAPEERAVLVLERRIRELIVGIVSDLVHVIPCRWIKDVVEAMSFALRENRVQVVSALESCRREIKPMQVGKIGLMGLVCRSSPI